MASAREIKALAQSLPNEPGWRLEQMINAGEYPHLLEDGETYLRSVEEGL